MDARARTLHIGTWPEMGRFYSVYVVVEYGASVGTRPAPVKTIRFVASVDGEAVDKQSFDLDFADAVAELGEEPEQVTLASGYL